MRPVFTVAFAADVEDDGIFELLVSPIGCLATVVVFAVDDNSSTRPFDDICDVVKGSLTCWLVWLSVRQASNLRTFVIGSTVGLLTEVASFEVAGKSVSVRPAGERFDAGRPAFVLAVELAADGIWGMSVV